MQSTQNYCFCCSFVPPGLVLFFFLFQGSSPGMIILMQHNFHLFANTTWKRNETWSCHMGAAANVGEFVTPEKNSSELLAGIHGVGSINEPDTA